MTSADRSAFDADAAMPLLIAGYIFFALLYGLMLKVGGCGSKGGGGGSSEPATPISDGGGGDDDDDGDGELLE